jgi:hypothetical protein
MLKKKPSVPPKGGPAEVCLQTCFINFDLCHEILNFVSSEFIQLYTPTGAEDDEEDDYEPDGNDNDDEDPEDHDIDEDEEPDEEGDGAGPSTGKRKKQPKAVAAVKTENPIRAQVRVQQQAAIDDDGPITVTRPEMQQAENLVSFLFLIISSLEAY